MHITTLYINTSGTKPEFAVKCMWIASSTLPLLSSCNMLMYISLRAHSGPATSAKERLKKSGAGGGTLLREAALVLSATRGRARAGWSWSAARGRVRAGWTWAELLSKSELLSLQGPTPSKPRANRRSVASRSAISSADNRRTPELFGAKALQNGHECGKPWRHALHKTWVHCTSLATQPRSAGICTLPDSTASGSSLSAHS